MTTINTTCELAVLTAVAEALGLGEVAEMRHLKHYAGTDHVAIQSDGHAPARIVVGVECNEGNRTASFKLRKDGTFNVEGIKARVLAFMALAGETPWTPEDEANYQAVEATIATEAQAAIQAEFKALEAQDEVKVDAAIAAHEATETVCLSCQQRDVVLVWRSYCADCAPYWKGVLGTTERSPEDEAAIVLAEREASRARMDAGLAADKEAAKGVVLTKAQAHVLSRLVGCYGENGLLIKQSLHLIEIEESDGDSWRTRDTKRKSKARRIFEQLVSKGLARKDTWGRKARYHHTMVGYFVVQNESDAQYAERKQAKQVAERAARETVSAFSTAGFEEFMVTENTFLLHQDCQEDLLTYTLDQVGEGTTMQVYLCGEGTLPQGPWEDLDGGEFTFFWEGWVVVHGGGVHTESYEDAIALWAKQATAEKLYAEAGETCCEDDCQRDDCGEDEGPGHDPLSEADHAATHHPRDAGEDAGRPGSN